MVRTEWFPLCSLDSRYAGRELRYPLPLRETVASEASRVRGLLRTNLHVEPLTRLTLRFARTRHPLRQGERVRVRGTRGLCSRLCVVPFVQFAVRTKPSFDRIGSSVTRKTTASSTASIACECQHGIAATSPRSSTSEKPPSAVIFALPLTTA